MEVRDIRWLFGAYYGDPKLRGKDISEVRADGGEIVFAGTPADLVAGADTLTARHLRAYLQAC